MLWLALLGAAVATRERRQLTIDVIARKLRGPARDGVELLTHGFTATVCALLAWHGARFVIDEMNFGGIWLPGLPSWLPILPLPLLLGLIGLRYALFCGQSLARLLRGAFGHAPAP